MIQDKILKHCKKHLSELREKMENFTYPDEVRARYRGAFFAYKDINDGIEKGYFNLSQIETQNIADNEHTKEVIACMDFVYMEVCDSYPHNCKDCVRAIKDN